MAYNEFIENEDEVTKECDEELASQSSLFSFRYILIVIIIILVLIFLYNQYGDTCTSYFRGAFPSRSDPNVDDIPFDLQKEVDYLSRKQLNNMGK
jgi:hypothetical protein